MKKTFDLKPVKKLFAKNKIAKLSQLKTALGTTASITVFRKIKPLAYLTSYSHGGAFYTLPGIPQYDQRGLWSCQSALFSKYGTLKNTILEWVTHSSVGYSAADLEKLLQVVVRVPLANLLREKLIHRVKLSSYFIYVSADPVTQKRQIQAREKEDAFGKTSSPTVLLNEHKASLVLFLSLLDERQKRFYAALETLKVGRGHDKEIAELLGIDVGTVARGRKELMSGSVDKDRIRKAGGGRKPLEKKDQTS